MPAQRNVMEESSNPQWFQSTHWSALSAVRIDSPHASAAIEKLCQAYWPPLYSYIRRQGHSPADAQDLTQAFLPSCWKKISGLALIAKKASSDLSCSPPSANSWPIKEIG